MKNWFKIVLLGIVLLSGCTKEDIDDEKPEIEIDFTNAFPTNCDTIYFGEPVLITMRFHDNMELGSYNIDIHHNFDHHSHSTEVENCDLWPIKTAVNPYLFINGFDIPTGLGDYETDLELDIPSGDNQGDFDEGDYHFFVSLTDKEGWTAQKGLSIKMLKRP